ncbi:hypothetical protein KP509_39G040300 [Ceratopteris richardii]|uniref:Cytochrome P450 n=1 Tax=Ceratopteris richardii TaxID=49495 RepID=A0A8T2Q0S3_CERRI|nr:hypothetical protein KP509_39G040300 [Ceratopteris richardii]
MPQLVCMDFLWQHPPSSLLCALEILSMALFSSLCSRHLTDGRLPWSSALLWSLACLTFGFLLVLRTRRSREIKTKGGNVRFPPGPHPWPIAGNLSIFNQGPPHRLLHDLARGTHGYGPIMGLWLGSRPAVVVSNAFYAREILLTHDQIFASRPHFAFSDFVFYGYNSSVIFSGHDPRLARFRKICAVELLTTKRLRELEFVRKEEIQSLLHKLHKDSAGGTKPVDVRRFVSEMTANTISRLLFSRKADQYDLPALTHDIESKATVIIGDFIPCLAFLGTRKIADMKMLHNRIEGFLESILAERRQAMQSLPSRELPHDFLQALLSKESCEDEAERLTADEIKGFIIDIVSAGVITSAVTLEWAMAELLRNPQALRKLQKDIDAVILARGIKQQELISDDDVVDLPYLNSVLKEVFRLHPAGPLLLPRISSKECIVGDYLLPKGTLAFVNTFAIGRDERYWERSEEFWPERYIQNEFELPNDISAVKSDGDEIMQSNMKVDVHGQHYELLPFGSGRRMCLGIRLGLLMVNGPLANLIRSFDWELPDGISPDSVDMAEKGSMGVCKATPVFAIPKPRSM